MGQEIRILVKNVCPAGTFKISWDGTDNFGRSVGGGIYFYQLEGADFLQTRKMSLAR